MIYFLIFIIGAIIGSFLNVVILRLNSGEKIMFSRSHCPHCQKELKAVQMVPILSFLWQRGRCSFCQQKMSWQYPLVELFTALLFVLITYNFIGNMDFTLLFANKLLFFTWFFNLIVTCFLVIIFVYDWKWQLILDRVTVPAMIIALLFNLWLGMGWKNILIGGLVGFGFFGLQFAISRGKWIGGGDLRLGFLMGLIVGWPNILFALFISYIIGSIISIGLIVAGKKQLGVGATLPFGTFLAIGTIIAMLWGQTVVNWYLIRLGI